LGALSVTHRQGNPVALLTVGRKIADIGSGRQAGKAWKRMLGGQPLG